MTKQHKDTLEPHDWSKDQTADISVEIGPLFGFVMWAALAAVATTVAALAALVVVWVLG